MFEGIFFLLCVKGHCTHKRYGQDTALYALEVV